VINIQSIHDARSGKHQAKETLVEFENCVKHINTVSGQNAEISNINHLLRLYEYVFLFLLYSL